jgi:hypothetical protein
MQLVAETELTIPGPIGAVFSQFIDFRRWKAWMPQQFRPIRGPSRPLRTGDRLLMLVTGAPSLVKIDRVEAPNEVCWSGGLPGLLHARHTFHFEAVGPMSTRIRSVEPWSGVLANLGPVAERIQPVAEAVGKSQLRSFERWFRQETAGFISAQT